MQNTEDAEMSIILSQIELLKAENDKLEKEQASDMLTLAVVRGYVRSLLRNEKIARYLEDHHRTIFHRFKELTE